MLFVKLTTEQANQVQREIKAAKKSDWFRRLTAIDLSSKKACSGNR